MADDHEFDHLPVELTLRPEIRRGSAQFREKPTHEQRLINEALDLLTAFGVPLDDTAVRLRERIALAVLAASDVKRSSDWRTAKSRANGWGLTTREIINYCNENFGGEDISSGSYDDVRRKHLIRAFEAGVIVPTTPDSSRNDPTRRWVLSDEFAPAVRAYGTPRFAAALDRVMAGRTTLAARFGRGAQVLYVGDAEKRDLYKDEQGLRDIGFFELDHAELPDVVAYSRSAGWLFVIEAVHSSGPISHIRVARLIELLKDSPAGIVFVTAFADRATFRKCVPEIAWETEVWISSDPDHLIHFNGDRFLGPHAQQ
jgi:hypothetical protein